MVDSVTSGIAMLSTTPVSTTTIITSTGSTTTTTAVTIDPIDASDYPDILRIAQYLLENNTAAALELAQNVTEEDLCGFVKFAANLKTKTQLLAF